MHRALAGLLSLVILGGCGDDAIAPLPKDLASVIPDLATAPPDLAVLPDLSTSPDLTSSPDLAGVTFCAGSKIDGTCLQAFFAPVSACFTATGSCTEASAPGGGAACWQGGAQFFSTIDMSGARGTWKGKSGAVTCMTGSVIADPMGKPIFTLMDAGGATAILDFSTNTYTCPGGRPVPMADSFGGCAALKTLIEVPMGACVMGKCP